MINYQNYKFGIKAEKNLIKFLFLALMRDYDGPRNIKANINKSLHNYYLINK